MKIARDRPNLFVMTGLFCVEKWSPGTEYFVRYNQARCNQVRCNRVRYNRVNYNRVSYNRVRYNRVN